MTGASLRRARVAGGLLTIAACAALLLRARVDGATLHDAGWTVRPLPLLASLALETAVLAAGVALWRRVLAGATGAAPPYRALLATWWRTSVSRYLPGRVWPFVAAELARGEGVPRGAMAATLAAHAALALVAALTVGLALGPDLVAPGGLASWSARWSAPGARPGAAACLAAAGVAVLALGVAAGGRHRLRALARHPAAGAMRAALSPTLALLHAASWIAHGIALHLFAVAVLSEPPAVAMLPAMIGAGALASGAGALLGVAPAGLGVREAVLGALLATLLPVPAALLLALAARPWATAAEALVGVLVLLARPRPTARALGTATDAATAGAR